MGRKAKQSMSAAEYKTVINQKFGFYTDDTPLEALESLLSYLDGDRRKLLIDYLSFLTHGQSSEERRNCLIRKSRGVTKLAKHPGSHRSSRKSASRSSKKTSVKRANSRTKKKRIG